MNSPCMLTLGTQPKQTHTCEGVILNVEKLFRNTALANSDGCRSILDPFLVDKLETLTCATWTESDSFPGSEDNTKGWNQLTGFLFDRVIEYLDTKYCMHSDLGYKAWIRLLWWMNKEKKERGMTLTITHATPETNTQDDLDMLNH